jgi:hypothetical protein
MLLINPLASRHRVGDDDDFLFSSSSYGNLLSEGVY